jgi:hypothetical protein
VKYQPVRQWRSVPDADYDHLLAIEEVVRSGLGDLSIVDDQDLGSEEMNIFIPTDDPKSAFEKAKRLLSRENCLYQLTAGYRDFEDDYIPVYPQGLDHFSVK